MAGTVPWADKFIPVENFHLWEGASPFFRSDALFLDLPFTHRVVDLDIKFINKHEHSVVLLGFLEGYAGPDDVKAWAVEGGYAFEQHQEAIHNQEDDSDLTYTLLIATRQATPLRKVQE